MTSNAAERLRCLASGVKNLCPRVRLSYEDDGVYIVLPGEWDSALGTCDALAVFMAKRAGIAFNEGDTLARIAAGSKRVRLSAPCSPRETDDDAFLMLSDDLLAAYMVLLPGTSGKRIGAKELIGKTAKIVRFGLEASAIEQLLITKDYFSLVKVGAGQPAVNGIDAALSYAMDYAPDPFAGREEIDFQGVELFKKVAAGQTLAVRTAASAGTNGIALTGESIEARDGAEAFFPACVNCRISPDSMRLYAAVEGVCTLAGGVLRVDKVLVKEGDALEDIDTDCHVHITGNVSKGIRIRAGGGVEVRGICEAASIIAGGSILLRSGYRQEGSAGESYAAHGGRLESGGRIVARFIEKASVIAAQEVFADSLLHCAAAAKSVTVKGRRGVIAGGSITALGGIYARIIGTEAGISTTVRAGQAENRAAKLRAETRELEEELRKCRLLLSSLPSSSVEPSKKAALLLKAKETERVCMEECQAAKAKLETAEEDEKLAALAQVCVGAAVFPGVEVAVGQRCAVVRHNMPGGVFSLSEGRLVIAEGAPKE